MINSQPSSTPGGDEVKDADEYAKYQETELFEDTLVLNSPFSETEVEKLNLDTEVIEDSDPSENMTTGITCEYEPEVVLDSEDEELNDKSAPTAARGFLEGGTNPTVENPSMRFQKRWPKLPREQVDSNATTNGKSAIGKGGASTDAESSDDNKHLYLLGRLNHTHSAGPRDSTQAALGFVDQYLSSSNMDMFQGTQYRKITREKSPHVLSVRGSLSLAKKIKARTRNEVKEPFNWADSNQNDKETGISYKKVKASSNVRSCGQTYKRRKKKGNHLQKNQNQGNCSNRCDESLVKGPRIATENYNSLKDLDVETCATNENVNIYSNVARTEDMSDIGLDTQIAAEAMDALAYPSPPGFHFNDAHRQEVAFDGSMSDVKQAHQKNSSCRENPGLLSIALKSNNRNESSCRDVGSRAIRENVHIFSSVALTEDISDIGLDTQIAAEAMDALAYLSPLGSHSSDAHQPEDAFDGSSSDLKQAHQKSSRTKNPGLHYIPLKSNKRNVSFSRFSIVTSTSSLKRTNNQESNPFPGKTKKIMGSRSTVERKFKNNTSSLSICREGVSHEEVCLSGEYTSFQPGAQEPKNWNKSSLTRIKEQRSHHTEKNNNVEETDIIRYKRKGNCLLEDPVKLDIKTKCPKLPTNSCGVARQTRLYPQVQISPQLLATGSFSSIDFWNYPKGPRGKRKRANAPKILRIDAKKRIFYSTRSPEGQDVAQPLLLAHVEISSNKSVAQLSSEISAAVASSEGMETSNASHTYNEHHKKPCEKNLPKASLLKELIRLGVPKSTSDMTWKDLRHRRDMTHVRVLFSQHLNDSVIKQQKKILSRFNISIAPTSMEATHFIADKFTRTKNMLEAMALGKLVVTHLWLESCGQANCFIDEKNYILRDMKKEKEIGFSMPVSLSQARQKPLLKGKRVYITPHIKPNKEVVASLVTAVHGQLVDENQIYADKNDKILDDLLILSCEDDNAISRHFVKKGVAVYSSELLLNGIVTQKLELERHKLLVNQVTRNNPSTFNRFGKVYKRRLRCLS